MDVDGNEYENVEYLEDDEYTDTLVNAEHDTIDNSIDLPNNIFVNASVR